MVMLICFLFNNITKLLGGNIFIKIHCLKNYICCRFRGCLGSSPYRNNLKRSRHQRIRLSFTSNSRWVHFCGGPGWKNNVYIRDGFSTPRLITSKLYVITGDSQRLTYCVLLLQIFDKWNNLYLIFLFLYYEGRFLSWNGKKNWIKCWYKVVI